MPWALLGVLLLAAAGVAIWSRRRGVQHATRPPDPPAAPAPKPVAVVVPPTGAPASVVSAAQGAPVTEPGEVLHAAEIQGRLHALAFGLSARSWRVSPRRSARSSSTRPPSHAMRRAGRCCCRSC